MSAGLPVYHLSPASADSATVEEIAAVLFGLEGVELEELDGSVVGRSGSVTIELGPGQRGGLGRRLRAPVESVEAAVARFDRGGLRDGG
jgi:hypothetical protein